MTTVAGRLPFGARFITAVAIACIAAAAPALGGQALNASEERPSLDHIHLRAADPIATKRLWTGVLGAAPAASGALDGVRVQNAFVWIDKGDVAGETDASLVRHLGLRARDLEGVLERAGRNGVHTRQLSRDRAELRAPNGVVLELAGATQMKATVSIDHVHCVVPEGAAAATWYAERFRIDNSHFRMQFVSAGRPAEPTKGRAFDHIGFVVGSREAYRGVLEFEPSAAEPAGQPAASVYATDPWGVRLELTKKRTP